LFVPTGEKLTTAEMTEAKKNVISHRGRAWEKFGQLVLGILN
jgi:inosine/xanthosine triphosphate pyrophosphatase family protein